MKVVSASQPVGLAYGHLRNPLSCLLWSI
uniref:Uncharacterized protein n=1 Tax=Anguilla anguilla TaxID=7936 RepID=A0A0E9RCB8_ANGAN